MTFQPACYCRGFSECPTCEGDTCTCDCDPTPDTQEEVTR